MNGRDGDAARQHAESSYLPRPRRQRQGIALALSGGGFRAALFHLGALRRLNELGVLSRVDTIVSVSGGSIAAAMLVTRLQPWPAPGERLPGFDERFARPLQQLTNKNIRTWPLLKRMLPWNWPRSQVPVKALARRLHREISSLTLAALPERPRVIFCATDLSYATSWVFERERIGNYRVGYMPPPGRFSISLAVAASSCFPPLFSPYRPALSPSDLTGGTERGPLRDAIVRSLSLTDGGVYDNMGLEPVWKNHRVLLVSDGGATFDPGVDSGLFWQISRSAAVMANQASTLRKRWLIASFIRKELLGAYWGIGSAAEHYGVTGGYPADLVDDVISEVRTDLDAFSEAEQAVLENHGYVMAEAALQRHVAGLIGPEPVAFTLPHPKWADEKVIRQALRDSHRRRLLGRF